MSLVFRYTQWVLLGLLLSLAVACSDDSSGDGPDPCEGITCSGNGTCQEANGLARCVCNTGFHADGLTCVEDLCLASDCIHGQCTDPATSSECTCEDGYTGDACEDCDSGYVRVGLNCEPQGVCVPNPCLNGGVCFEDTGSFRCECETGYAGSLCVNCDEGYHDEDGQCLADTPCSPDPCVHGLCSEVNSEAFCQCETGYEGPLCDHCASGYVQNGLVCELENPEDPCLPENPCTTEHQTRCEETDDGNYECLCDAGYHDESGSCVEDTECDPDTTCSGHGSCVTDDEGFSCDCNQGYWGEHCDQCDSGYIWDDDVCIPDPDNPCNDADCPEPHRGACVPGEDGSYTCTCDEGFDDVAGVCYPACDVGNAQCQAARASFGKLVSANGHGAVIADLDGRKIADLFEHVYKTWGLDSESGDRANSRDMLYDSYLGLKVNGSGTWMNTEALDYAGYYRQEGILHFVQHVGDLKVETFAFAPWELSRPALVLLGRVTNRGSSEASVGLYSLHNYRLGSTDGPSDTEPEADGESMTYNASQSAYTELGPGGGMVHMALGSISHYGAGQSTDNANNPWQLLSSGSSLTDVSSTGTGDDIACAFQNDLTLAAGESGWLGVVSAFDRGSNTSQVADELSTAYQGKTPEQVLTEAVDAWESWRKPAPQGLSNTEQLVYRVSEAMLRMGQVWEPTDASKGQILAALPPGAEGFESWHIAWVRDMSYAIAALIRMGHYTEAKEALRFMLDADSGHYTDYTNTDYQISITRYFGNGTEETDSNENGPNIEYDGFGLFLWVLNEYINASGDTAFANQHWDTISQKIAGALMNLRNENGMIDPDSSIWELHWNGQQKQVTYTSLAAARGLCDAGTLAGLIGQTTQADAWQQASRDLVAAIRSNALDGNVLVQSVEEFQSNAGHIDAAVVEAFNWLLFDPAGSVAQATFQAFDTTLSAASGMGYFRNDDGGFYDGREWVFVDMRIARALRLAGQTDASQAIVDWTTAQALNNMGLVAELYDPSALSSSTSGAYEGAVPMIGFGAGAYTLNLWERANPTSVQAPCSITW